MQSHALFLPLFVSTLLARSCICLDIKGNFDLQGIAWDADKEVSTTSTSVPIDASTMGNYATTCTVVSALIATPESSSFLGLSAKPSPFSRHGAPSDHSWYRNASDTRIPRLPSTGRPTALLPVQAESASATPASYRRLISSTSTITPSQGSISSAEISVTSTSARLIKSTLTGSSSTSPTPSSPGISSTLASTAGVYQPGTFHMIALISVAGLLNMVM